jgi:hypothetical protein
MKYCIQINDTKPVTFEEKCEFLNMNPQATTIRELIKTPKQTIQSGQQSNGETPTYKLSKHITSILIHLLHLPNAFTIKEQPKPLTRLKRDFNLQPRTGIL